MNFRGDIMTGENHKIWRLEGGDFELKWAIYRVACVLSLESFLGDYGWTYAWIWDELNKAEYLVSCMLVSILQLDGLRVRNSIKRTIMIRCMKKEHPS